MLFSCIWSWWPYLLRQNLLIFFQCPLWWTLCFCYICYLTNHEHSKHKQFRQSKQIIISHSLTFVFLQKKFHDEAITFMSCTLWTFFPWSTAAMLVSHNWILYLIFKSIYNFSNVDLLDLLIPYCDSCTLKLERSPISNPSLSFLLCYLFKIKLS